MEKYVFGISSSQETGAQLTSHLANWVEFAREYQRELARTANNRCERAIEPHVSEWRNYIEMLTHPSQCNTAIMENVLIKFKLIFHLQESRYMKMLVAILENAFSIISIKYRECKYSQFDIIFESYRKLKFITELSFSFRKDRLSLLI